MQMGLGRLGLSFGQLGVIGGIPDISAQIVLSASTIPEDAALNTVIGALSVINGSGSYTFTELADPDAKFNISVANLRVDAAFDYETATSHSVTIQADNGVDTPISRVFTITVTDVSEGAFAGAGQFYQLLFAA